MSRILVSGDFAGQGEAALAHHNMLPGSAVIPLLSFMVLLLSASLYGLAASGHFPAEHRAPTLRSGFGRIVLFGSLALCLFCLVGGISLVWHTVPWYAAVIGGGATVLIAPLLLQPFPDSFVNGRAALVTFSGLSLAVIALLWCVV
jgi:hypothetical protein